MLIRADKKELLAKQQIFFDKDIAIENANKILSVCTNATINNIELLSKEGIISYCIDVIVIFRDKEGNIDKASFTFDQNSYTIKNSCITPKSVLKVDIDVISNEYVGTKNLKIRTAIELSGYIFITNSFECYNDDTPTIFKKKSIKNVEEVIIIKETEIVTKVEQEFGGMEILSTKGTIALNRIIAQQDVITVEGSICLFMCCLCENKLKDKMISIPFNGEILAENVTQETKLILNPNVKTISIQKLEKEGSLCEIDIVVSIDGYGVNKKEIEFICDVYSKENYLNVDKQKFAIMENICISNSFIKCNGSIRLEEDRAREIQCIGAPSATVSVSVFDNKLYAEGIVCFDVIYIDMKDEEKRTLAEIPYKNILDDNFNCKDNLVARATVCGISSKIKLSDEFEFNLDLMIKVEGSNNYENEYITAVAQAEEKPQDDIAISLYIINENEDLFDVAKELNCDQATLLEQNEGLEGVLTVGDKIILMR